MATPLPLVTEMTFTYGEAQQISPLVRRVVAENPSKFTFRGTGTYIVGQGRVAVIDPGPALDGHVEALLRAVEGETVTHLLVTHTHRDHSPASRALAAATGAPILAYGPHPPAALAAERAAAAARTPAEGAADGAGEPALEEPGDSDFAPDVVLRHGDVVRGDGWTFEALHTPGHISNHLCFALRDERALFSGDHVMGWSTSVIPPPDGRIADYLDSLRLLLPRDEVTYYPTHGPPVTEPRALVTAFLEHRLEREDQIVAALAAGHRTIATMVPVMYADVRAELHPVAARSVLAHLVHLVETGRVVADGPVTPDAEFRLA